MSQTSFISIMSERTRLASSDSSVIVTLASNGFSCLLAVEGGGEGGTEGGGEGGGEGT